MIRDRITSPLIHAVTYDIATQTMAVEFTSGRGRNFSPVPYEIYRSIIHSRFPEKTFRQLVRTRVLV